MKKLNLLILFFLFSAASVIFPQKRAFTLDDIYQVKNIGGPVLSPAGDKIAYTLTSYDLGAGKSLTQIWLMNSDGSDAKNLIPDSKSVYNPLWSKDGKKLYYLKYTGAADQLFEYSFADGTSTQLTDFHMGISDPVLSGNGSMVAFTAKVYPECGADNECNKVNYESFTNGPIHAHISDKLLFRHWTEYRDGLYSHLFILNLKDKSIKDLTPGEFDSPIFMLGGGVGYNFTQDDKQIAYVSNHDPNPESSTNADIWLTPVTAPEPRNLTPENKAWDGTPVFSPDGRYLAYRKQMVPGYESDRFRIAVMDALMDLKSEIITGDFDNWVNDIQWSPDSRYIYFTAEEKGYTPLYRIDVMARKYEKIIADKGVGSFTLSPDGKKIYYTYRLNHLPAEIYSLDIASGKETQLTSVNKQLLEEVDFRPVEHHWVEGANGKKIHTMIVKPHGFDPSKKYPVVLNIHGGPQSQWMDAYRGDNQLYAGYGYIYVIPNPHGSTGYGQEFTHAISGDYTGKIVEDIMKISDYLESLPYVDKDRIGAMGWSYGGYMMNWLQGTTKRYKCFVSMMGLYDMTTFYGTTEELWFPEYDMKGTPWTSDLYEKDNPAKNVKNFSTPTLIITGERDYRVSYNQSLHYFTDLQKMGVPSKIIIFDHDGHWPSHIKSMPLYYNAHLEWFNKYLGGAEAPYNSEQMVRNRAFSK
ncbi:MAG: S9 family peptidase [Ignavibacteriaceae bacterium]|nr:S9 family peptidase [Ignavibacteriaceae bacterium]